MSQPAASQTATSPNDAKERNESAWRDPDNWHWGVYHSPDDARVWVPKPVRWTGWTLNFAHSASYAWLAAILTPAIVTLAVVALVASTAG